MACEEYFAQDWKSVSAAAAAAESENISGGFDCNICLDFACNPIVTLCGHLYCWPCIYKWFHTQRASLASDEHPQCPVCKAEISQATVVPLYGPGNSPKEVEPEGKAPSLGMAIPPRPPACGTQALVNMSESGQRLPYHNPHREGLRYSPRINYEEDSTPELFSHGSSRAMGTTPELFSHGSSRAMGVLPPVGMFGEMVYARVFGNSESLYAYPNSYRLSGSSNPRLRRQEMQIDKSLNRISIFLFCCSLLCLLLF